MHAALARVAIGARTLLLIVLLALASLALALALALSGAGRSADDDGLLGPFRWPSPQMVAA